MRLVVTRDKLESAFIGIQIHARLSPCWIGNTNEMHVITWIEEIRWKLVVLKEITYMQMEKQMNG